MTRHVSASFFLTNCWRQHTHRPTPRRGKKKEYVVKGAGRRGIPSGVPRVAFAVLISCSWCQMSTAHSFIHSFNSRVCVCKLNCFDNPSHHVYLGRRCLQRCLPQHLHSCDRWWLRTQTRGGSRSTYPVRDNSVPCRSIDDQKVYA